MYKIQLEFEKYTKRSRWRLGFEGCKFCGLRKHIMYKKNILPKITFSITVEVLRTEDLALSSGFLRVLFAYIRLIKNCCYQQFDLNIPDILKERKCSLCKHAWPKFAFPLHSFSAISPVDTQKSKKEWIDFFPSILLASPRTNSFSSLNEWVGEVFCTRQNKLIAGIHNQTGYPAQCLDTFENEQNEFVSAGRHEKRMGFRWTITKKKYLKSGAVDLGVMNI